ncbi:MAG: RDD family protein [Gemmataceae bacterium]|nr:RDD family protein [Gemmataceae bacterium]
MESPQGIQDHTARAGDPVPAALLTKPLPDIEIVPGDASKDRLIAAVFDNLIALMLGFTAVSAIPNDQVPLRATAWVSVYLAYFFLTEAVFGSSPGKMIFGLWVRRLEGGRCSWRQAGVRTLARLFEVNPILLGAVPAGIAVFATPHRQRLGDMMAGTTVRKGRGV